MDSNSQLYKRRWAFLGGLAVLQYFAGISFGSYGQVSGFYVEFFNTTHATVDWITNARNIGGIFITVPLAWLVFKEKLGLRGLVLLVGLSSTVGLLFVTLSFISSSLLVLIVIGQVLTGVAEIIGVVIPSTFAALWFPENQVGTAIAVNIIAIYLGDGSGYVLPSYLVFSTSGSSNSTGNFSLAIKLNSAQHHLQIMYGAFLGISAVATIFFALFFTSTPPTPPTYAQELKVLHEVDNKVESKDFWKETKLLFTNYSYVFLCLNMGLIFQIILLENMMMSEIVKRAHDHVKGVAPHKLSGYIMSMYSVGSFIGVFAFGKAVDLYKGYKLLAICAVVAVLLSSVAITVCVVFKQVTGMFVGNAFFGLSSGAAVVVFLEMVTQSTYPVDESLANIYMTGIQTTIGMVEAFIGRIVFDTYSSLGVLLFQCGCISLGLVLTCFLSSRNRRLEVSHAGDSQSTDKTPLVGASSACCY